MLCIFQASSSAIIFILYISFFYQIKSAIFLFLMRQNLTSLVTGFAFLRLILKSFCTLSTLLIFIIHCINTMLKLSQRSLYLFQFCPHFTTINHVLSIQMPFFNNKCFWFPVLCWVLTSIYFWKLLWLKPTWYWYLSRYLQLLNSIVI